MDKEIELELYQCNKCGCEFYHEIGSNIEKVCENCHSYSITLIKKEVS